MKMDDFLLNCRQQPDFNASYNFTFGVKDSQNLLGLEESEYSESQNLASEKPFQDDEVEQEQEEKKDSK